MTVQVLENILTQAQGRAPRNQQGLAWLKKYGVPTRRDEAWKYTPPEKFLTGSLRAPAAEIIPALFDLSPFKIFFKDGAPDLERSTLPSGVTLTAGLPEQATILPGFAGALSAANAGTGATLNIPANTNSSIPIVVVHENDSAPAFYVNVGRTAQISILEAFGADKEYDNLCAPSTWFNVAEGAHAEHIKTVIGGRAQIHIGSTQARLARDAHFDSFVFAAGAKLMRQELDITLCEAGAHTNVHGLFALRGEQHADQHVSLNHLGAHTTSDQLFKMVLDDEAHGVFTGRLEIAPNAQKVDAAQLNKNLILSKKAHVDTRPQLMVHADDVKCAHGATVGQLSPDEVFYLQSRGLSQARAQKILCHAFASDALMHIKSPSLRAWVSDLLYENFEQFALEKFDS